jgi:hypothetical protein
VLGRFLGITTFTADRASRATRKTSTAPGTATQCQRVSRAAGRVRGDTPADSNPAVGLVGRWLRLRCRFLKLLKCLPRCRFNLFFRLPDGVEYEDRTLRHMRGTFPCGLAAGSRAGQHGAVHAQRGLIAGMSTVAQPCYVPPLSTGADHAADPPLDSAVSLGRT